MPLMDDLQRLMDAERLVTARLAESVLRASRIAGMATPEVQDLFQEWLSVMGAHILEEAKSPVRRDIAAWARELGIGETSLFSLLVQLHRSGKIRVCTVEIEPGDGRDAEECGCLMAEDDIRGREERMS